MFVEWNPCAPCLSPYTLVSRYLHRVCGVKSFTVFVSLSAPCLSPCLHRVCGALAYLTYYYIHSLLFLSRSKTSKCQMPNWKITTPTVSTMLLLVLHSLIINRTERKKMQRDEECMYICITYIWKQEKHILKY